MIKSEFISELSKAKQKKSFQLWNNKSYYILFLQLTTIILALISTSLLSHAKKVTLAWDSSDQASGYILYYGLKSRSYENMIDVGNNLHHTVTNLSKNHIYYFAVTAYNEFGESVYSAEKSFRTADNTGNEPPIADAGEDQTVDEGDTVIMDSSYSSDPDDGIATYQWEQIEGTPVELSDSNVIEPSFICPEIGSNGDTLTFRLTVIDHSGVAASDTVKIFVNDVPDNVAFKISNLSNASAAAYEIVEGLLDGAACYIDRSYSYSNIPDFLQGAIYIKTANNDKSNMADPLLSFDVNTHVTVYVAFDNRSPIPFWLSDFTDTGYDLRTDVSFSIYAKDFPAGSVYLGPNHHSGSMYTVIVVNQETLNEPPLNEPPIADAGEDQTVDEGDTVIMDSSYSSDPDDGIATYQWEQIEGRPVKLSDSNVIEPSFICPEIGSNGDTLTFRLTVTDHSGVAASDTVKIFVNDVADNVAFKISNLSNASAAAYEIVEGLLDGAACYIDRSYSYSNIPDFLQGAIYIKTANNDKSNMADPLLSFDVNTHVTVYVAFDNRSPIPFWLSDFTDTGYDLRTDVSFSIYAKDFPAGSVYLGPNRHSGSMYTVIVVNQETLNEPPLNEPPIADAGEDQTVDEGDTVIMDSSYSSDPDDGIATYQWEQIEGTPVKLSDSNVIEPSFICPEIGSNGDTLTFRLTVIDHSGVAASDTVKIFVNDVADNVAFKISNLSNASAAAYEIVEGLLDGAACYIDRSYSYSNIPGFLQGAIYIKTANNDKSNMADPLLSFDVNTHVTVYVAFDNRSPIPFWLSDFTDTGYDLRTDVSFSIYAKDFPAGSVYLGPNRHSGSMYTVIVVNN